MRAAARRVSALALAGLAGCAGGAEGASVSEELLELERLEFVPAAPSFLTDHSFLGLLDRFADVSLERALVVDRFEVTRGDVLRWGLGAASGGTSSVGFVTDGAQVSSKTRDWPAYLTFAEARELGALRGMRLPTPKEWLYVATGGRGYQYPYHQSTPQSGFANTRDLKLGRPAIVGSFEKGRSKAFGCYDLHGNVWEWVDGVVPGRNDIGVLLESATDPRTQVEDQLASAMGGSYQSPTQRTFQRAFGSFPITFLAKLLDKRTLRPDVGARHVADAETYLLARAGRWGDDRESRARVRAVGAVWADTVGRGRVVSFLEGLGDEGDVPVGISRLLEGARGEGGR